MEQATTEATASVPTFESYGGTAPENYERYFVPVIGRPLAERLVERAALQEGERVVDLACGTGIVARLAAERVGSTGAVDGVDINPGMLGVARTTSTATNVRWYEASADALPLDDESTDIVLCQMGLQFFPDKAAALLEARRILRAGGRLVLNLPGPTPALFATLESELASQLSSDVAKFVGMVFSLHEHDAVAQLISAAGFATVDVQSETRSLQLPDLESFLWQYAHSTPLAAAVASLDETRRAALAEAVISGWQQIVSVDSPVLELGVTTAVAQNQ